jgi:hypothetical protein
MKNAKAKLAIFFGLEIISVILLSVGYVWLAAVGSILLAVSGIFSIRRLRLRTVGMVAFCCFAAAGCFLMWYYLRPSAAILAIALFASFASEIYERRRLSHDA